MKNLKHLYSISLGIAIILVVFMGYYVIQQLTSKKGEVKTTITQGLVELQNHSQVQLVISNKEGRDITYKICTTVDNSTGCFLQPIREGKRFTYRRHFYFEENEGKEVIVIVYKEGEPEPIEKAFWHIKP